MRIDSQTRSADFGRAPLAAIPSYFRSLLHFSSILPAEIRIPHANGLEIFRESVTLDLTTSLSYGTAGTHSPFPSFNPHPWPQADTQRGH